MKFSWESAVGALAITGPVVNAISLDVTNTGNTTASATGET